MADHSNRSGGAYVTIGMKALLALLLATAALADEPTLTSLSEANRYALTLDRNSISGPGVDFLLRSAAAAQFVAIAEEHNVAELAQFTSALFRLLHEREGFNYFADEQDPWMCHAVSRSPTRGNFERIAALHRKYPNAFTFQGDEEMAMLADIGRLSTAKSDPIWGLDQVFGALHILESLPARQQTRELIEIVRPLESKRFVEGQRYMLDVGSLDDLVALKKTLWLERRISSRSAHPLDARLQELALGREGEKADRIRIESRARGKHEEALHAAISRSGAHRRQAAEGPLQIRTLASDPRRESRQRLHPRQLCVRARHQQRQTVVQHRGSSR
jgi:hypothetical protein